MDRLKKNTCSVYFIHSSKADATISVLSALVKGSFMSKLSITWLRKISFFKIRRCGQVKPCLISSCSSETGSVSKLDLKNTMEICYY